MTVFCCICKGEISEKRARRGCKFCGPECHAIYRKQRRDELASRRCRLCGRPVRRSKSYQQQQEAVHSEHNAVSEAIGQ